MYLNYGKPILDIVLSFLGVLVLSPFLILIYIILLFIHQGNPLFFQKRIGLHGAHFTVFKFKTLTKTGESTWFLKSLRKTKVDELPQLFNILKGEMSLVGPRPDVPGYYDLLEGEERKLLQLKPGLTGYASLKFSNEEELLKEQEEPLKYNDQIIFPEKVKLNLYYYENVSLLFDLNIIIKTVLLPFRN